MKSFSSINKKEQSTIFDLIQKAENISDKDPKRALDYLEQALSQSLKEGNKMGEAMSYSTLGKINYNQGLYSQSIEYYNKALQAYESQKDKYHVIKTRNSIGEAFEATYNYSSALDQYKLGLAEAEQMQKINEIVELKNNIAGVYKKQLKYEEALAIYKEVLALEEKRNNRSGIIAANNNIGNIYLEQEKTKKAMQHYEKSREIAVQDAKTDKISESYGNISNTLRKEKKFKSELELRKKSAELNTSTNNQQELSQDFLEIGKVYIEQKSADEAIQFLEKSVKVSKEIGNIENEAEAQQAISEAYKQKKDFVKALEHYQLFVTAKDSLLTQREKNLSTMISFNDELSLKQKKINLLEKDMKLNEQTILLLQEEKNFSRVIIYALSIGFIIVFGGSWIIYNSSRKRRIANQVLALKSLRSQMNPHFIFNALNSVNNYISKNDERSANKYLSDFSKLMRTVMENSRYEFITLTTELNILQLYLSLEHSRFKEKFDFELNVSDDIHPDQTEIPPMLIQPYIENAVWHGLRYKEDKGFLRVNIEKGKTGLIVTVEDNGIGRKKSAELKTHNQKDKVSMGLKNTESRIDIINELYRTRMKVDIEDLFPETQSGTKVIIHITQAKHKPYEA